jgi:nicotinate-nucleotide adenylyltransferase
VPGPFGAPDVCPSGIGPAGSGIDGSSDLHRPTLGRVPATAPETASGPDGPAGTSGPPGRGIGLFGGTFDPPHVGHLVTAVNVRHALGLDRVVLMVANQPWQKQGQRRITPAEDRYAMVVAAVAGVTGIEVGRWEIDHGGPSFTADTLAALAAQHPGVPLYTIVGDDAAAGLRTWERFDEVVRTSTMVVVDRPGEPSTLPDDVPWVHVEVPRLEVSSTDLRSRVADGRPLDYLVPDAVLRVIRERGLYDDNNGNGNGAVAPTGGGEVEP